MKKIDKLKLFKEMIELKYSISKQEVNFTSIKASGLINSGFDCYKGITNNQEFDCKKDNLINDTLNCFDFLSDITEVASKVKNINNYEKDYLIIKNFIHINISKKYHFDNFFIAGVFEVYIYEEKLSNFLNMLDERDLLSNIENNEVKKTKRGRL